MGRCLCLCTSTKIVKRSRRRWTRTDRALTESYFCPYLARHLLSRIQSPIRGYESGPMCCLGPRRVRPLPEAEMPRHRLAFASNLRSVNIRGTRLAPAPFLPSTACAAPNSWPRWSNTLYSTTRPARSRSDCGIGVVQNRHGRFVFASSSRMQSCSWLCPYEPSRVRQKYRPSDSTRSIVMFVGIRPLQMS